MKTEEGARLHEAARCAYIEMGKSGSVENRIALAGFLSDIEDLSYLVGKIQRALDDHELGEEIDEV